MTIQQLTTEYNAAREHALTLNSRGVDPATLQAAVTKAQNLKTRLENAQGDASMSAAIERATGGMTRQNGNGGRGGASLGAQFINSETYQWLKQTQHSRPEGTWNSPSSELMAATLSEDSASGGDLVLVDQQTGILPLPTRRLVMADLPAPGHTDANTVGYMAETAFTDASATVREGDPAPESTVAFDNVTDPVRKISAWLPVTDEMLQDVPSLRSYLDARLRLGVQLAEDNQLLNGSIVAPDIIGFLNRTGLAASLARTGSETNADRILDQISAIELATSLPVDAVVLNPANWATILKSKDGNGQYYGGGPLGSPARPLLWGRPVVVTSKIVANTALVGAFKTASQLFRHNSGLKVDVSNAHADFFVRGLQAIKATERAALAVYRPSAFGTVTSLT